VKLIAYSVLSRVLSGRWESGLKSSLAARPVVIREGGCTSVSALIRASTVFWGSAAICSRPSLRVAACCSAHSSPYGACRSGSAALKPRSQPSANDMASGVRIVAGSMTTHCTPQGNISQRRVSE